MKKLRPRPKVQGVTYRLAADKNKNLKGAGGGVPRRLRSGADEAMRRTATSRAASQALEALNEESEGES